MWLTANQKIGFRQSLVWFGVMVFAVVFQVVYYQNSHDVFSNYITYLWVLPLALLLLNLLLAFLNYEGGVWTRFALNAATATLMVYLAIKGIYEIALTYSTWTGLFFYLALIFYFLALILFLAHTYQISETKRN
jgi:hypothetical protein